jgi:selenocysteine-specific elongation factor
VLDIFPPTRHKRAPERLALLKRMREDDPAAVLGVLAGQAEAGIDLGRFSVSWNLGEAASEALWRQADLRVIEAGDLSIGIAGPAWAALKTRLLDTLAAEHERAPDMIGVEPERLRRMTSVRLARPAFDALTTELLAAGAIAQTRSWLHLPGHRVTLDAADRALFAQLKPLLDARPFNPPRVRDVHHVSGTPEPTVRSLFKRVARAGELYPVARDHYFTAGAVAELAAIVHRLNEEQGAARAAPFRDIIFADGGGGR